MATIVLRAGKGSPLTNAEVDANFTNLNTAVVDAAVTASWASVSGKPATLAGYGITDAQALDADLTAIAALAGTSGFLKKTAANTWSLDTNTYLTSSGTAANVSGTVAIANGGTGATTAAAARTSLGLTSAATTALSVLGSAGILTNGGDGVAEIGRYLDFHAAGGDAVDYVNRIESVSTGTMRINSSVILSAGNYTTYAANGVGNANGADLDTLTVSGMYRVNATETNRPTSYGQLLVMRGAGDTLSQIYADPIASVLYHRSGNPTSVGGTGTLAPWKIVVDSGNYNNYAPTLTGTGASGNWGISVTGNAATVTNGVYTTGNQTVAGVKTFSSGIIAGSTQGYASYSALIDFGADVANTWRRVVGVGLANNMYSTIGFRIDVIDPVANNAQASSVNTVRTETYYVACVRSSATTLDTPDACYVTGPSDRIRATKTATGNYEVHIQNSTANREFRIEIRVFAVNGTHALNYYPGDTPTADIAQYASTVSTTAVDVFQNVSARSLASTVATGTAPLTIASTTRVANLNVATAGTADTLTTARAINGVSFNGSADITVADATKLPLVGGTLTGNLTVNTGADSRVNLQSSGVTQGILQAQAAQVRLASANALPLVLATNGVDRLFIDGSTGNIGIGTATTNGYALRINKSLTGASTYINVQAGGMVASDVTSTYTGVRSIVDTAEAAFTLTSLRHFVAQDGAIGAGSAITEQNGFYVGSNLTNAATNIGFRGLIPSGTNRWNLYLDGTANNYMTGSLGIGSTSLADATLKITREIQGGTTAYSIQSNPNVASAVTGTAVNFNSAPGTAAATFTLSSLIHYRAFQNTLGAGSTVSSQNGFVADASMIGAGTNIGFRGAIPAATGRWNLYMDGSAQNYLAGRLGIGTTAPAQLLHVAEIPAGSGIRISGPSGDNAWAGGIEFYSNNGTTVTSSITASSNGMLFTYGGSERARINSAGNLGIGTSSPTSIGAGYTTLSINNTTAGVLDLMANGVSQFRLFGNGTENRLQGVTNLPITFFTNSTERMRLDASGNLAIGATSTSHKLDVVGSIRAQGGSSQNLVISCSTGVSSIRSYGADASATALAFFSGVNERMRIDASGNLCLGTSATGEYASGVIVMAAATAPTTSPSGVGQLYVQGGALKFRGSAGTVTIIAPA